MSSAAAEYLVSHGCSAIVSRCRGGGDRVAQRGDQVVIRSVRGLELGEVLCAAAPNASLDGLPEGVLLRQASADDTAAARQLHERGRCLLAAAEQTIDRLQLPLVPLDVDLLLDGSQALLQVLSLEPCSVTTLLEELRARHGLQVTLHDLSRPRTPEQHECGSCSDGGCDSCDEGGCSTGGCGSGSCAHGSVGSPEELTAYFAQLREQMHAAIPRVPLI